MPESTTPSPISKAAYFASIIPKVNSAIRSLLPPVNCKNAFCADIIAIDIPSKANLNGAKPIFKTFVRTLPKALNSPFPFTTAFTT